MSKKKDLRRKIAKQVEEKMYYLKSCPNERDMILNIILPKEDRLPLYSRCRKNCLDTTCENNIDVDNQLITNKIIR